MLIIVARKSERLAALCPCHDPPEPSPHEPAWRRLGLRLKNEDDEASSPSQTPVQEPHRAEEAQDTSTEKRQSDIPIIVLDDSDDGVTADDDELTATTSIQDSLPETRATSVTQNSGDDALDVAAMRGRLRARKRISYFGMNLGPDLNDSEATHEDSDSELSTEVPVPVPVPALAGHRRRRQASARNDPKRSDAIDTSLPPVNNVEDCVLDMCSKALGKGLEEALERFAGRQINVATMMSGTESPVIFMQLLSNSLQTLGKEPVHINHVFSAEIDAMKQAFIERNFRPSILFRDAREFIADNTHTAFTAYGAEVPIPGFLDILIAGFVCKDISRLNNNRKGLDDNGESGDTWRAIYSYCKRFRPSIVLLENVTGLKEYWNSFVSKWNDIGYDCAWMIADTKDYYIPQTRNRMYMIAVNREHCSSSDDCARTVREWQQLMKHFERPCSSSFDQFLPETAFERTEHKSLSSEPDWPLCRLRYAQIRSEEHLGLRRPFTQWSENGSIKPVDFANRTFLKSQSSRVADCIEIQSLRSAKTGYDARYSMEIWDVSQNVDRFKSTQGIVPCITPNGIPFATHIQDVLNGRQLLLLQGMPEGKLLFGSETQKDCQDLAGNAMTTTVIGASIISALIATSRTVNTVDPPKNAHKLLDYVNVVSDLIPLVVESIIITYLHKAAELDLKQLLVEARLSSKLCGCEGSQLTSKADIRVCNECGHTACTGCSGNPHHQFNPGVGRYHRMSPDAFENKWQSLLPSRLCFQGRLDPSSYLKNIHQALASYIAGIKLSSQRFYLSKFIRQERSWSVIYDSEKATLVLSITDHAEWLMTFTCDRNEPGNSKLREALAQDFIRGKVSTDLLNPRWEMRLPTSEFFSMNATSSERRISSWRNRLGLVEFCDESVPFALKFESSESSGQRLVELGITGNFTLLPNCGTAMETLYKSENGVYLFLDQNPIRWSESSFVFSRDCRRMDHGNIRQVLARLAPSWRPWNQKEERLQVQLSVHEVWAPSAIMLCPLVSPLSVGFPKASALSAIDLRDCGQTVIVSDIKVEKSMQFNEDSQTSCIFNELRELPEFMHADWHPVEYPVPLSCNCSPTFPRLTWSVDAKGATPHEDRREAAIYECNIKSRRSVFKVLSSCSDTSGDLQVQVSINLASLIHRVRGKWPNRAPRLSWRVIKNHSNRALNQLSSFELRDTITETLHCPPTGFLYDLTQGQRRSLTWMASQESGNPVLSVSEIEEEVDSELRWRVEAKAEVDMTLRGGVLADLPSFGKTVTTIALIESELQKCTLDQIVAQNRKISPEFPALIELVSTLVICPPHIVRQWRLEFESCLGAKRCENLGIIAIETFADLEKISHGELCNSHVVIVSWSVLADENYITRLAQFAAMPPPASFHGRAFDAWLDYALIQVKARVEKHINLNSEELDLAFQSPDFKSETERLYKQQLEHEDFKTMVPLRLQHGKNYQSFEASLSMPTKTKETNNAPLKKLKHAKVIPLLQLFNFNRIVVDEYHYLRDVSIDLYPAFAAIQRLSGYKRWVLSGTPSISNFEDVHDLSLFLGARLAADTRNPQSEQTDVERFIARTEVKSYQWHHARHVQAQKFLDRFARQNTPELSHIESVETLQPVELHTGHYAIYLEHSQILVAHEMQLKKQTKFGDRWDRFNATFNNARTAEEALQNIALLYETEQGTSSLDSLIKHRKADCERAEEDFLRRARQLHRSNDSKAIDYYQNFKQDVVNNNIVGDQKVREVILSLFHDAEKHSATLVEPITATAVKQYASELREIAYELARRVRNERFIRTIEEHLPHLENTASEQLYQCSASGCLGVSNLDQLFLIAHCGHTVCQICLQTNEISQSCLAPQCESHVHSVNLVKVTDLSCRRETTEVKSYGAKLDEIAQTINRIPDDDQVILFVPNSEASKYMERLFKTEDISFYSLGTRKSAAAGILEDFKSHDTEKKRKLLVLNIMNEFAAGANLVNANHIIFVAPLLTKDQSTYDSVMAQAIARCRRYRQTKTVHVYHFAALKTIDIDILEHRHKLSSPLLQSDAASENWPCAPGKKGKSKMIRTSNGEVALVPRSLIKNEKLCSEMGVTGETFTSLIGFSNAFEVEHDD
ncbi:unnamed protein product [Periconia digitata]|uniref:Helicase C-terminal domain-containing protein n=1 Tax=Periconia digitata TaxID=1303443 RepID=A0A9W4XL18_9PLEO|nr:unnamed protein product [Periconia digitata]